MASQFLSQTQAMIEFVNGPLAQKTFLLSGQMTWIGNDPKRCNICIPHQSILPQHAVLTWRDGLLGIRGNRQITVNQIKISGWKGLSHGDRIGLEQDDIVFRVLLNTPFQESSTSTVVNQQHVVGILAQEGKLNFAYQQKNVDRFSLQKRINVTNQQGKAITSLADTETTRYLCATAHLDKTFRSYVLKNIVGERHKAQGEAYGIDIIAVVKCCFAAERRIFIRNSFLFVVLLIITSLLSAIFSRINEILLSLESTYCYYYPQCNIGPVSQFTPLSLISSVMLFSTLIVTMAWLIKPSPQRGTLCLITNLLLFYNVLLPLYLLAWIITTSESLLTYYGPMIKRLRKGNFRSDKIQIPLNPELEQRLKNSFDAQTGKVKVIVYSGYTPFVGAGYWLNGWSFLVDITKGKRELGKQLTPLSFTVSEMYDDITKTIGALDLSKWSDVCLEDKLYVNGQEIRTNRDFLDDPLGPPRTEMDFSELAEKFLENPTEAIRHYKCIRATSWRGELVLSVFFRFMMVGKNLFIEADFLLLPSLKEEYYQIDRLNLEPTIEHFLELAMQSFLPTFSLLFGSFFHLLASPARMLPWRFKDWATWPTNIQMEHFVQNNPAFDYGASTSLRQFVSASSHRRFFQELDEEMYVKVVEYYMLENILNFLDSRNIDTSEFGERQETILNNGVIVTGGSFLGTSIAAGNQAQAKSMNTK